MALIKRTRKPRVLSAGDDTRSRKLNEADWDRLFTDGMIYLLALGGFYITYQTLLDLAILVGYPSDQAHVVAALADLAILAYSRKAIQEVNAGRSAWGIRAIVAVLSLGTFALQLRAAWPHPVAVGFHALPPAVWIIGHEMMLRGRVRRAKTQRREREIAAGLRPAPLPSLRRAWWILDPYHTFIVWRLTKLWEKPQDYVIRTEAAKRQAEGKDIPRAWQGALITPAAPVPAPVLSLGRIVIPAMPGVFKDQQQPRPPKQRSVPAPGGIQTVLYRMSNRRDEAPADVRALFLASLPAAPAEGRPKDSAITYIQDVEQLALTFDIRCTGRLLAELLGVDETYVSRLRKEIRASGPSKQLVATP